MEKQNRWVSVNDNLPKPLKTVWISNGKGWTTLGCLVETPEGWHWAETNGIIYQEGDEIVSECEGDDLDVNYWHELPKAILDSKYPGTMDRKGYKSRSCTKSIG